MQVSGLGFKILLVFGGEGNLQFFDYKKEVKMNLLKIISDIFGVLAVLICLMAGLVRVSGSYYLAGFEVLTLFNAGMALMVFACLLKLHLLQLKL